MTTALRFAIRTLFRRPIALAMVISIVVGVGVNVAAHSVLRRFHVEPPVAADNPKRLITISPSVSYPQYEELKARETRSALAASEAARLIWHDQSATTTVGAQVVSWNYFEVLRTRPLMGRTFADGENDPLRVVVTYACALARVLFDRGSDGGASPVVCLSVHTSVSASRIARHRSSISSVDSTTRRLQNKPQARSESRWKRLKPAHGNPASQNDCGSIVGS